MPDDLSRSGTLRPVTPPRIRSFAEPFSGTAADGPEATFSSGVPEEIGSLAEPISLEVADAGPPDTHPPEDTREIRSPAELFFLHPAHGPGRDATSSARLAENRSPTEPISANAANPPNPWRRTPEHEEREARADEIGLLVSQWEIGTVHRIHALAASHELDVRSFLVLSELVARPGGLTGSELTGVVGGGRARMSVLLRGLQERGLVDRDPDPFDRRSILAGATDRAREILPRRPAADLRRLLLNEFTRHDRAEAVAHFVAVAAGFAYRDARDLREGRGLI